MMSNSKSTLKAFVMSIVVMLMCMTMLFGTTYAWMTDSVSTGPNTIVAGNLDIELEYYNGDKFVPVEDNDIFADTLWEPGTTKTVYLKLSNEGSVDLAYKFSVKIVDEYPGENIYGETFMLSDNINVSYSEYDPENMEVSLAENITYADMTRLDSAFSTAGILKTYHSETAENEKYIAIVASMPENTSEDVNYIEAKNAPHLILGIDLLTAQVGEGAMFSDNTSADEVIADMLETSNVQSVGSGSKIYGRSDTSYVIKNGNYETLAEFGFDTITEPNTVICGENVEFSDLVEINIEEGATLVLEGITFEGGLSLSTYESMTEATGTQTEGTENSALIVIKNCTFKNKALDINSRALYTYKIDSCTFKDSEEYAIGINTLLGDSAKTAGIEISSCTFKYIGTDCIEFYDICYDALVTNNVFDTWGFNDLGAAISGGFAGTVGTLTVKDNEFVLRETDDTKHIDVAGLTDTNSVVE